MSAFSQFFAGMITAGYGIAGLFFLKFWRRSEDVLFLAFSVAFWLLALNQILLTLSNIPGDDQSWIYLLRLGAFGLIGAAIVHKNASPTSLWK
jgi:uncharacterized membrane protein HdeD (DUF308 family)